MRVLVLGDCHGQLNLVHQATLDAIERWAIGAVIQVGDFGLFPKILDRFLHQGPRRFPVTVHVIDGNHEDHRWLHEARQSGRLDELAISANLRVQPRGSILELDGARIGMLGGALHADRRQEYAGQWRPGSKPRGPKVPRDPEWANWVTEGDVERAVRALSGPPLDLLVTHSCPAAIGIGMVGALALIEDASRFIVAAGHSSGPFHDCGEQGLTRLWRQLPSRPPLWLFGHFHSLHDRTVDGTRFVCVGSADDSDGVLGVRPVIYDTSSRSLEIHADLRIGLHKTG